MAEPDPASAPRPDAFPPLPRGPHRLDHEAVLASQRARLLAAMAHVVATKGYGATVVADLVTAAGVSRRTFYELFDNKEECFLATVDAALESYVERFTAAALQAGKLNWRDRIDAGLGAAMDVIAERPDLARLYYLDILAAGPRALEHRAEALHGIVDIFQRLLDAARHEDPQLPPVPDQIMYGYVAGAQELVMECVRTRGAEALPELRPTLVALAIAIIDGIAK